MSHASLAQSYASPAPSMALLASGPSVTGAARVNTKRTLGSRREERLTVGAIHDLDPEATGSVRSTMASGHTRNDLPTGQRLATAHTRAILYSNHTRAI